MHLVSHKDIMQGLLKPPQGCIAIMKRCVCMVDQELHAKHMSRSKSHVSQHLTDSLQRGRLKLALQASFREAACILCKTQKSDGSLMVSARLTVQHSYNSLLASVQEVPQRVTRQCVETSDTTTLLSRSKMSSAGRKMLLLLANCCFSTRKKS